MKKFRVIVDAGRAEPISITVEAENEEEARESVEEDLDRDLGQYTLKKWRVMRVERID